MDRGEDFERDDGPEESQDYSDGKVEEVRAEFVLLQGNSADPGVDVALGFSRD